ncbi:MAG: aspartate carbamoyltransferase regulatory subunit [Clostridiales bacterium]|nr:aspartate carbamoyltransferase regulatory subunit [Clostridiales bacterium]
MNIDSITNGYVIDHIEAGKSMQIYEYLNLGDLDCSVAIIRNVKSKRTEKKDIIKIDEFIDINMDVLGYLAPDITVNVIKNGEIIEKKHMELPEELKNIIKCENPRCITSVEQDLDNIFKLTDRENRVYRCKYCESKAKNN